jgi:hypothetical protein
MGKRLIIESLRQPGFLPDLAGSLPRISGRLDRFCIGSLLRFSWVGGPVDFRDGDGRERRAAEGGEVGGGVAGEVLEVDEVR